MKTVQRLLAKEVRRIRTLVELTEMLWDGSPLLANCYRRMELNTLRRILAVSIKENPKFR